MRNRDPDYLSCSAPTRVTRLAGEMQFCMCMSVSCCVTSKGNEEDSSRNCPGHLDLLPTSEKANFALAFNNLQYCVRLTRLSIQTDAPYSYTALELQVEDLLCYCSCPMEVLLERTFESASKASGLAVCQSRRLRNLTFTVSNLFCDRAYLEGGQHCFNATDGSPRERPPTAILKRVTWSKVSQCHKRVGASTGPLVLVLLRIILTAADCTFILPECARIDQ